jgi:hypothetical protein
MVVIRPGDHTWTFASEACADSLPWLADQVGHLSSARTGSTYASTSHYAMPAHRLRKR